MEKKDDDVTEKTIDATEKTVEGKKKTRNAQDVRIESKIGGARTLLHRIKSDKTLLAKCGTRGFSEKRIDDGIALVDTVQNFFNTRQQLMGEQHTGVAMLKADHSAVYEGFFELRECGRIAYPTDTGIRDSLGATGRIPTDGERFQTVVRAALAAAAKSPQKEDLAAVGFTEERHALISARVDAMELRRQSVETIKQRALQATVERDLAFSVLHAYLGPLERTLKLIERLK